MADVDAVAKGLVEKFHAEYEDDVPGAAKAGTLASRFARDITKLRERFVAEAGADHGGRDPLGEALRALAGRWGDAAQVPLLDGSPVAKAEPAKAEPAKAEPAKAEPDAHAGNGAAVASRLRSALVEARRRVRQLEAENQALREELLSAGEMIETLALDLEKPE